MKFYLGSGSSIDKLKKLYKKAISKTKNKSVYIIDLATDNLEKQNKTQRKLTEIFDKFEINFASQDKYNNQGIVFLVWGDTELLLKNIKKKKLLPVIKKADVVLSLSAGTLALCKETILTKDEDIPETKIVKGLGLIHFAIEVHYTEAVDKDLIELSKKRDIFAIPDDSTIVYDGKIKCLGKVYKFSKGKKNIYI